MSPVMMKSWVKKGDQIGIPAVLMRGGTSKGLYFKREDLPENKELLDKILLSLYGSPDVRQIDGIGGGDPLTSKAIIVGKSHKENVDIEYTFCQVGIDKPQVSYGGNCGNMLAGVGPFAIDEGLIEGTDPMTVIRILNLNTNQIIIAKVPTKDGKALTEGEYAIAGVPKPGAEIKLTFINPQPTFGKLLPTGNPVDVVEIENHMIHVSFIDATTPFIFVDSEDLGFLGVNGSEDVKEITSNEKLMITLENIRSIAAKWLNLVEKAEDATNKTPNIPRVAYVSKPKTPNEDIIVRQMSMQRVHKAFSVTGAICIAVASTIKGTVINKIISAPESGETQIRIAHPSGVMNVSAGFTEFSGKMERSVTISRTARRIMSGYVFIQQRELFSEDVKQSN